jgi:Peptidase M15
MLVLAAAAGVWFAVSSASSSSGKPDRIREAAAVRTPRVGPRLPRAHPHVLQPQAGVAAPSYGTPTTPIGDPTAHAPPLSKVKQELKILNLCGGATSPAFAQPVVHASGPGFVPDPGTIQNVGQLPVLTARLDALAKALGVIIYGISGYRTPAHSVAVGGYADDPHTKGLAEDIGVNSLLRSSAAQISEPELARFGMYRPFDPTDDPNNPEVNHIQLIPASGVAAPIGWSPDPRCK